MRNLIAILILSVVVCSGNVTPAADRETMTLGVGQAAGHAYEIPASLNSEERKWFRIFQEGNFLSDGWQDISAEILAKTSPEERSVQKVVLDNLGRKIGMEWCRSNSVRKVNSAMLMAWGDILRATARKNPQQIGQAIAFIDQKVDAALN
ncbi:MAG: hypothetical protein FWD79_00610 [Desulfobulbus sp.]|nr:hypothetical protein [Desulfobulbus sp.]